MSALCLLASGSGGGARAWQSATAGAPAACDMKIPAEAREGLLRAWLAILKERHREVTWIPRELACEEEQPTVSAPEQRVSALTMV